MGREEYMQVIGGKGRRKWITVKTTHRYRDNIKMDLGEIGWGVRDRRYLD
jgi:hypothetical protein